MLRILFSTRDLSRVKAFCTHEFQRVLSGQCPPAGEREVPLSDFVFAKEVKLARYRKTGSLPPAAAVASAALARDPRAEPLYGERVPYVVVYGAPGARLKDLVVCPHALTRPHFGGGGSGGGGGGGRLMTRAPVLNAEYYITKQLIPALKRALMLAGGDVEGWYTRMPRRVYPGMGRMLQLRGAAVTIDQHFATVHCELCGAPSTTAFCTACRASPQLLAAKVLGLRLAVDRQRAAQLRACRACTETPADDAGAGVACRALSCPLYFASARLARQAAERTAMHDEMERVFSALRLGNAPT